MILAIDFDGVIHDKANPVPGRRMGPPIEDAVESMMALQRAGHRLIVHSVWAYGGGVQTISEWLAFYKVPFDQITNIKPQADVYLDDRAVRFTTWAAVREMLRVTDAAPVVNDLSEGRRVEAPPATSYEDECQRAFFGQ